ncbi:hypothetical protein FOA52_003926 [Chlamydomonas sp. UWO 241]|nr:hypothetical protein FOA52_003926 [Chlamydomonas sp. UWO 241]
MGFTGVARTRGDVRLHHESSSSGAFRGFAAVALAGGMAIALGGRGGGGGGGGGGSGSGGSGSGGGGGSSARKLQAGAGVAATTGGLRHSSSVASGLAAMARASRRRERSQRWEGVTE